MVRLEVALIASMAAGLTSACTVETEPVGNRLFGGITTVLDVWLEEGTAQVGATPLVLDRVSGTDHSGSTSFTLLEGNGASGEGDADLGEGDAVFVDLCPGIADLGGGPSWFAVEACHDRDCRTWVDVESGLDVSVTDGDGYDRRVDIQAEAADGSRISLRLGYLLPTRGVAPRVPEPRVTAASPTPAALR